MPGDKMDFSTISNALSKDYAQGLDVKDPLRSLRDQFVIPTREDLKKKSVSESSEPKDITEGTTPCTYLCGNSLGLQPKRTRVYIDRYLNTWGAKGVYGHFRDIENGLTTPWVQMDDQVKVEMAKIVGAMPDEVAVMGTLTANLHFLMASFYRPTKEKYKIIIDGKAFPSDHYAVQSQLAHHNFTCEEALVLIEPSNASTHYISTQHIIDTISAHADTTALILLPGIHFYSGQFLDVAAITSFAHSKGILIGWDLAHAAGNVSLKLHEWNVDFAAWCTYKYLNAGPGAIGGLFVHQAHGRIESSQTQRCHEAGDIMEGGLSAEKRYGYTHRLCGWWGSDKSSRFAMNNVFVPISGAGGWQISNPSVFDVTSLLASLSVFDMTSMQDLRERSLKLTGYLEYLLENRPGEEQELFSILTPKNPAERGAQISVKLKEGFLDEVMEILEEEGVVVDERKPDVVRIAPAPIYNNFGDVWRVVDVLFGALKKVKEGKS